MIRKKHDKNRKGLRKTMSKISRRPDEEFWGGVSLLLFVVWVASLFIGSWKFASIMLFLQLTISNVANFVKLKRMTLIREDDD